MASVEQLSSEFRQMSGTMSANTRFSWIYAVCSLCDKPFENSEVRVYVDGQNFHSHCFRCAQCFEILEENKFYNVDGRFYCKHDFFTLYAPVCGKCEKIIEGAVKIVFNSPFHSHCFHCMKCDDNLELGVWNVDGLMLCINCKQETPMTPRYKCSTCRTIVDEEDLLRRKFDFHHAYHFNCKRCKKSLTKDARELDDELYCPRCYDLKSDICADCKRPIDHANERSILALDKHYHVDHFRCYHCGRPFMGTEYFEKNKKAYCRADYLKLFADLCFVCQGNIVDPSVKIFGKSWCLGCYRCMICWKALKYTDTVACMDDKPMCKQCLKSKNFQRVVSLKAKELKQLKK